MKRPFADAFPPDYDPAPVRRAVATLAVAALRHDCESIERTMWRVAGDGVPGYVVFDLIVASAELAAEAARAAQPDEAAAAAHLEELAAIAAA